MLQHKQVCLTSKRKIDINTTKRDKQNDKEISYHLYSMYDEYVLTFENPL